MYSFEIGREGQEILIRVYLPDEDLPFMMPTVHLSGYGTVGVDAPLFRSTSFDELFPDGNVWRVSADEFGTLTARIQEMPNPYNRNLSAWNEIQRANQQRRRQRPIEQLDQLIRDIDVARLPNEVTDNFLDVCRWRVINPVTRHPLTLQDVQRRRDEMDAERGINRHATRAAMAPVVYLYPQGQPHYSFPAERTYRNGEIITVLGCQYRVEQNQDGNYEARPTSPNFGEEPGTARTVFSSAGLRRQLDNLPRYEYSSQGFSMTDFEHLLNAEALEAARARTRELELQYQEIVAEARGIDVAWKDKAFFDKYIGGIDPVAPPEDTYDDCPL